ncbi:MAG: EF-hand domain-containing protein [Gammaproteobacteria bacterium]|nr:EF-hand domain-containing protein [Gammaproteobacteria bacterium]
MSTISGNFSSGFNPSQMMQGMCDRFQTADTDGNEAVSRQEFVHAMEETGLNTSKTEKIFDRMDSNGDGEVTTQEYEDIMSVMEQRMSSLMSHGSGTQDSFDAIETLMESLESEADNDEEKQRWQDALGKMRSEGYNESTLSESLALINDAIPRIDATA